MHLSVAAHFVALRKESVDRNLDYCDDVHTEWSVALRKESVDRNIMPDAPGAGAAAVALRKESVDRNIAITYKTDITISSLSARRAWIEMIVG